MNNMSQLPMSPSGSRRGHGNGGHFGGGGIGGMAAQMGLMSMLHTGNPVMDTMLLLAIPMLLSYAHELLALAKPLVRYLLLKLRLLADGQCCTRTLRYEKRSGETTANPYNGAPMKAGSDDDHINLRNHNGILQKALVLYVKSLGIEYEHANLVLMDAPSADKNKKSERGSHARYGRGGYGRGGMRVSSGRERGTRAEQLKAMMVTQAPMESTWIEVADDVSFFCSSWSTTSDDQSGGGSNARGGGGNDAKNGSGGSVQFTMEIKLRSTVPNGHAVIDAFVNKAFEWYVNEQQRHDKFTRYMYMLDATSLLPGSGGSPHRYDDDGYGGGGSSSGLKFKRYSLSERKTFDSLFFPERQDVLETLENFTKQKGKFAIPGFPHKLGLLLHGPPGTGKTSLIKAIAAQTKRHIVSIPLSKISTNQQLMDIVFDQVFPVAGLDVTPQHSFEKIVFVLEDLDAASKIVKRRDSSKERRARKKRKAKAKAAAEKARKGSPKCKTPNKRRAKGRGGGGGRVRDDEVSSAPSTPTGTEDSSQADDDVSANDQSEQPEEDTSEAESFESDSDSDFDTDSDSESSEDETLATPLSMGLSGGGDGSNHGSAEFAQSKLLELQMDFRRQMKLNDQLNLAGVLNVIDGIVDTEGRLLVMTTNHPEKLDPALIRPGRIDLTLKLDYIRAPAAISLLEHYFAPRFTTMTAPGVGEGDEGQGKEEWLTEKQRLRVRAMFDRPEVQRSPAYMEQNCARFNDVDSMLDSLEAEVAACPAHPPRTY